MLRPIGILAGFLVLVCLQVVLWNHRFEAAADAPTWNLRSLEHEVAAAPSLKWSETGDGPVLRLAAGQAALLRVPGMPPADFIRLRCRLAAHDLEPGSQDWQDGRLVIEWWRTGAGAPDLDPVVGVKYGLDSGDVEWVLRPLDGPAVPMIRLGHLGKSGMLELRAMEIVLLRERPIWLFGRWILVAGWLGWAFSLCRSWPGLSRTRAAAAALVIVALGVKLMVPGPWRSLRGLLGPFSIEAPALAMTTAPATPAGTPEAANILPASGSVEPLGKIADQGDFVLKVKLFASKARPLLHAALLGFPALVLILLLGPRPAVWTSAGLALAIEASQTMFGYGFGWDDTIDLACDAIGILAALWIWKRLSQKIARSR